MAELISLKMTGIRSIGDEPHVIKFLNPLTIIQGLNGTGKTTTVEALNYITTGSQPSGGMKAFIHSNTIANKKRVDGSIMLTFRDAKGQEVTATKRMYATTSARSKKGEATTRSDEFTLSYKDGLGETHSISSKVLDFNKEMINRLGVPKAILDLVLFCHQEESNWPLSEPKSLKSKFDAIFEVTKYTRALQNVKKMIKDFEGKIKEADAKLPYLLENRKDRIRALKEAENCKDRIEFLIGRMQETQSHQKEIEAEIGILRKSIEKAEEVQRKTELRQQEARMLQRQLDGIEVADYSGTIEQLKKEFENITRSQEFASIERQKSQIEAELREIAAGIQQANREKEAANKTIILLPHELERKKQEKVQVMEKLDALKEKHREDFLSLMGAVPEQSFKATVNKVYSEFENQLRSAEAKVRGMDRESAQDAQKLRQFKTELTRKQGDLSAHMQKIARVASAPQEVKQRIEETSEVLGKMRSKLGQVDGCDFLYEQWENDVMECRACPLCERSYSSAAEAEKLAAKIRTRRSDLPKEKGQLAAEVRTKERDINNLNQVVPLVGMVSTIENKDIPELERKIADLEIRCNDSEGRRSVAETNLGELRNRERIIKRIAADASLMDTYKENIANLEKDIVNIQNKIDSGSVAKARVAEADEAIERYLSRKAHLESGMNDMATKQQKRRILTDQLKKFELRENLRRVNSELDTLRWDGEPLQDMKTKQKQLNDEGMRLNNEYHKTDGELSEKRKKKEELRRRIQEKFQNVDKEFRELLIQKCVWKQTARDLKNYFRVVDESIISFHQSKMEQINYILEDLWRRVYKGTDIQTIKIKSNPVDMAEDKRKSYDYCVMMTVDSVEVEMRDRCSAGQKVLASILIRIALADVFAGRCSILTLDEPTTNLDVVKVEAMGEMLVNLINNRVTTDSQQSSRGFQLIVITHDLRLVENLYRDCKPECVYGLSKDAYGVSRMKRYTHFELTN